jgi:nucleotide-binding universal stress UspA family protein
VILGSVADYVVHHADDVAVLLVHPGRVIEEAED